MKTLTKNSFPNSFCAICRRLSPEAGMEEPGGLRVRDPGRGVHQGLNQVVLCLGVEDHQVGAFCGALRKGLVPGVSHCGDLVAAGCEWGLLEV